MKGIQLFARFCVMHFLCDFPLQGDFLAKGKDHTKPLPGVPWFWCLLAHGVLQGAGVGIVSGSLALGAAEMIFHMAIDYGKCAGWYGFTFDQLLHLACKAGWAAGWQ